MNKQEYLKNYYWKYWINAREEIYGVSQYDRKISNYIEMLIREGGTVLDVAIGTGFPIGDYFYKAGYDVHGIDISPQLLEKCKKYYPSINCKLGDAHSLPYADETFDCTYSLHSSWYFYDIHKAIDEMIRVTRTGGFIIIDVMNKYNWLVKRGYNKRVFENQKILGRSLKTVKNILKIILRKGIPEWQYVVHFNPTDPEEIYKHLNSKQISQVQIMVSDLKELLSLKNTASKFQEYPRIVFVVLK